MAAGVLESNWPNLMNLAHKDEIELANLLGLALGPARRLAAAIELHHRLVRWAVPVRPVIQSPEQAMAVLAPICDFDHERFYCLALDPHCRLIGDPITVYVGDVASVDAGPRGFYRNALLRGATSALSLIHI
jgi:DNA repair protein RadC